MHGSQLRSIPSSLRSLDWEWEIIAQLISLIQCLYDNGNGDYVSLSPSIADKEFGLKSGGTIRAIRRRLGIGYKNVMLLI